MPFAFHKWFRLFGRFPLYGVKQGGVLPPILFSVYIDELLKRLKESEYGCYIGNTYFGALSNADDVTLLCPTSNNVSNDRVVDNITFDNHIIDNIENSKHLGNTNTIGKHSTKKSIRPKKINH